MEKDWTLIYKVNQPYQAELIKQALENEGIETVVIDKQDSSYHSFGAAEIYVNKSAIEKSNAIIQKLEF